MKGFTLLETMVAAMVLMGLTLTLFFIYQMGASAWKKGEAQTQILQDFQASTARLVREVERSTYSSLSVAPAGGPYTACSFLSPIDDNGLFCFDPIGQKPIWQKYVVMWYDAPAQTLFWREIPLAPGSPEAGSPEPIDTYDAGGNAPLTSYCANGQTVAVHVSQCEFLASPRLLTLRLEGTRKRYGSPEPEKFSLETAACFRN